MPQYLIVIMKNFDDNLLNELYKHSWSQNYGDDKSKETAEFWDKGAKKFAIKAHGAAERESAIEFLNRFSWFPTETVLDVAAGPGTYAIPLAKMVKQIVATDFSEEMLSELRRQAGTEQIDNIKTCYGRWLDIEGLSPADTVLCLNCLGVISVSQNGESMLKETLLKLKSLTQKRLIMLIPHADSPLSSDLRLMLNQKEVPLEKRRIGVLYLAMVDCGMLPDLQIIRRPFRWIFDSVDEAVKTLLKKSGLDKNVDPEHFREQIQSKLYTDASGHLHYSSLTSQALYVWSRDSQGA